MWLSAVERIYYEKTSPWRMEKLNQSDCIKKTCRGAIKAYSKACFKAIGGLKCARGLGIG